ncbi:MAG TPA: type II toxin-antitoxin system RelE/ParE family toxin [Bradyrhizobium sp.]|jgi:mRNA interferase RelE/StbE|nr:type II toxin-antitoxin system RelE/ParE family toxin [Bradyrhizobium sp.]
MRSVVFKAAARRQWMKLPPQLRKRIATRLNAFAQTGQGDVKKLKGQDGARLRVGDYRVIFYQESDAIVVAAVGHRRDIYD